MAYNKDNVGREFDGPVRTTVQTLTVTTNAVTPNVDGSNMMECSHNNNLTINNPSGTPGNMQRFTIRVNNTAAGVMTVSLGTLYRFGTYGSPVSLTQIPAGKSGTYTFMYDSGDTKWDVMAEGGGH